MVYAPHTPDDVDAMLEAIGVRSIDELFKDIPILPADGDFEIVPKQHAEMEVAAECRRLAARNMACETLGPS